MNSWSVVGSEKKVKIIILKNWKKKELGIIVGKTKTHNVLPFGKKLMINWEMSNIYKEQIL